MQCEIEGYQMLTGTCTLWHFGSLAPSPSLQQWHNVINTRSTPAGDMIKPIRVGYAYKLVLTSPSYA